MSCLRRSFRGSTSPTSSGDFAVDFTDHIEARRRAEGKFGSQGHDAEYAHRRVEIQLGQQGMWALVPRAEGVVQQRPPTVSHIELTKHSLRRSTELRADTVRTIAGKRD